MGGGQGQLHPCEPSRAVTGENLIDKNVVMSRTNVSRRLVYLFPIADHSLCNLSLVGNIEREKNARRSQLFSSSSSFCLKI